MQREPALMEQGFFSLLPLSRASVVYHRGRPYSHFNGGISATARHAVPAGRDYLPTVPDLGTTYNPLASRLSFESTSRPHGR